MNSNKVLPHSSANSTKSTAEPSKPKVRILRLREVQFITGFYRTALLDASKTGRFPDKVKIGPRQIGWRSDEVEAWLENLPRGKD